MQAHPWQGALTLFEMRGYSELPYRAIIVAHEHHMKVDLTGYPKHIRPRQLGLFSRIVSVADGFDAATTRRSYQTVPVQPDEVLREMWENPRRGYDPVVVKALINLIGIYPVGTCVILDNFEIAIVAAANPELSLLNRPMVRVAIDADGAVIASPGRLVNLAEQDAAGEFPPLHREGDQPGPLWPQRWPVFHLSRRSRPPWPPRRGRGAALIPYLTAGSSLARGQPRDAPRGGRAGRYHRTGHSLQRSPRRRPHHPAVELRGAARRA